MTTLSAIRSSGILPEGTYRFKVIDAEEREGEKGIYWNFTCECLSDPFTGQKVFVVISHSPAARFKADQWLDAHNIPEEGEVSMETFLGKTFRGTIVHREIGGKMRANVESFLPDVNPKQARQLKMDGMPDDVKPKYNIPF